MDFFGRPKASAPPAPTTTDASAAPPKAIPWVEKYRPRTIDDVAAQGEVVQVLRTSLETKNLPHLLFYGPPGTGKTSTILALTRTMYGTAEAAKTRVLELNASDERGIAVVREKVKTFARAAVGSRTTTQGQQLPPYKIVILDEADSMTSDAQAALRRIIEKYSRVTRFCLVCNYVSRIIEPLASRCAKFRFKPVPSDNAVQCLSMVAHRESVVCRDGALDELVRCTDGDLRRATMALQSAARIVPVDGALDPQIVRDVVGLIPDHVILALRASWGATETHAARALVDDL
ncbi:Subunit of heteropentameric Replication factor C (RF-C), partial [Coemansia sp. IMI 209127]